MKNIIESILDNAKKAYKESVMIDNIVIQELLLSILTDAKRLQEPIEPKIQKTRERITLKETHSRDIDIIAYIFSEYEHSSLFPEKSQTDAVQHISDVMNVKYNTFTNKRDAFDRYTNSSRKGWEKDLSPQLQIIFDEYKSFPRNIAIENGEKIIEKYKNLEKEDKMVELKFNNKIYTYGGRNGHALKNIVYDIIEKYLSENRDVTYNDLKSKFNHLHGSKVVLNAEDYAQWLSDGYENKTQRYFSETVANDNDTFYILNQWEFNNLDSSGVQFIEYAKKNLSYHIEVLR